MSEVCLGLVLQPCMTHIILAFYVQLETIYTLSTWVYRTCPHERLPHVHVQAMLLSAHAAVRVRGWRMNLRPLAEIQTLLWLPVAFLLLWACWHVLLLLWSGLTAPYEDSSAAVVQPAASSRQLPHQHRHPAYAHHAKQRT